jgi:hypothetical protein
LSNPDRHVREGSGIGEKRSGYKSGTGLYEVRHFWRRIAYRSRVVGVSLAIIVA